MTNLVLNGGGRIKVTPAGSGAFDVTIDGIEYTQAFNTNVASTIDDFVSDHADTIKAAHGIFLVDGTTTLDLNNAKGSVVTSGTATVADKDYDLKRPVPSSNMTIGRSGAVLTLNLNEDVDASFDVVTLNLVSSAMALQEQTDIVYNAELIGARSSGGIYDYSVDHYATFA